MIPTKIVPMYKIIGGRAVELDPLVVGHVEVTVDFDGVPETRHARLDRVTRTWSIRNSSRAFAERVGILESHAAHQATLKAVESRVGKLEKELAGLKGKRGVETREKRAQAKAALKSAKAVAAVAASDAGRVAKIAECVDETHPMFVNLVL